MTQKAIARECADWIRKKAIFKSNSTQGGMGAFLNVQSADQQLTYMPLNGFTTVDIGCDRGNNIYNMVNKMHRIVKCIFNCLMIFGIMIHAYRILQKM